VVDGCARGDVILRQRPEAERRADAEDEGERETGEAEEDKTVCKHTGSIAQRGNQGGGD
jgi:hypothetical protein